MKKVRARARARALHQLIQQPKYRAISAPSLAGLGWVWAELSNLGSGEFGILGIWDLRNLGPWEFGNFTIWEFCNLGSWEFGII